MHTLGGKWFRCPNQKTKKKNYAGAYLVAKVEKKNSPLEFVPGA